MPHPMKNKPAVAYFRNGKCFVTSSTLFPMSSRISSVAAAATSSVNASPAMVKIQP